MSEKYIFVIDTDQYAGNFEREMCACCTGQIGECEVGEEESKKFRTEVGEEVYDIMDELVEQRPDDHGCSRPTSLWRTPIYLSPKGGHNSVAIFFYDMPSEDILTVMKDRAEIFIKGNERIFNKPRTMKILGFRLLKETTIIEEIIMSDDHCAICGGFNTTKSQEDYTFPYGKDGPEQVEFTVEIPILTCKDCGFKWWNWEAGQIMDAYVEQYKENKKNERDKNKNKEKI